MSLCCSIADMLELQSFPMAKLNAHLDQCLSIDAPPAATAPTRSASSFFTQTATPLRKRRKVDGAPAAQSSPLSSMMAAAASSSSKKVENAGTSEAVKSPAQQQQQQQPTSPVLTMKQKLEANMPLAERLRPRTLEEFVGQSDILQGPLGSLYRAGRLPSCILWGPPGTGKTTLARILARRPTSNAGEAGTSAQPAAAAATSGAAPYRFVEMSATNAGAVELRKVIDEAGNRAKLTGERTLLFVDEIQRWSKAVQDVLLPPVERGQLIVLGATTENPSFRLQAALLSRMRVFVLSKLSAEETLEVLRRATERAATMDYEVPWLKGEALEALLEWIAVMADGDARTAVNALEMALTSAAAEAPLPAEPSDEEVQERLTRLKSAVKRSALQYDRTGDNHYDAISALHKSIRGSDADAAVYWLVRMIEAGDDALYIARRLIVAASEDCSDYPLGLQMAVNCYQACNVVGLPECAEPLAQTVVALAEAPKSTRSYRALKKSQKLVKESYNHPVPIHIRNAPTKLLKEMNHGKEYRYEPAFAHPVHQEFFPPELKGTRILSPPPADPPSLTNNNNLVESRHLPPNGLSSHSSSSKPGVRWTSADAVPPHPEAQPEGLASTDAQGPGSCQRVWKIGERAVDLDFLEEWEKERNAGVKWSGRGLLGLSEAEEETKEEMEIEKKEDELEKKREVRVYCREIGAQTESCEVRRSEAAAQTDSVPSKTYVTAATGTTDAAAPSGPAPTSTSAAVGAGTSAAAPAAPPKRRGRFREPVETWDPSCLLDVDRETPKPAYAVILLNAPLVHEHRRAFEHVWNNAAFRICADGGANRLYDFYRAPHVAGQAEISDPHAIRGDLDSLRADVRAYFERRADVRIEHHASQYSTDLQKCIQAVEDAERAYAPPRSLQLLIWGGLSGRLDQTVHTLHVLWQLSPAIEARRGVEDPNVGAGDESDSRGGRIRKRARTWVVSENSVAWVLPKGKHELHLSRATLGKTCGMLPIGTGQEGVRISTTGLEWDLDGTQPSALGGLVSTSNHLADAQGRVGITTDLPFCWTVELKTDAERALD